MDLTKHETELLNEYNALLIGRWQTDLANTSAFLFQHLKEINWVGFYLAENETLWLGPFQGLPACTEIAFGKGVCGTAAQTRKVQVVADVHQFPGHIACDPRSRSEIVLPLIHNDRVLGVLDVDSANLNRFSNIEKEFLKKIVNLLIAKNPIS